MNNDQFQINFSDEAIRQIELMLRNDFTLEGKSLRLTIKGKECDGFTYAFGFTSPHQQDVTINITDSIIMHMDKFTAYYFKRGFIDYAMEPDTGNDGFVISNFDQDEFHGKFFKDGHNSPLIEELT